AHRPWLGHVHERWVNHRFPVRVIVTAGVAADLRAFTMLPPREKRQIVHRVENSPLRWLESVARIRQRARNDYRHRVIEKRTRYFLGYVYRLYFFVWIQHDSVSQKPRSMRMDVPRGSAPPTCAKSHPLAGSSRVDRRAHQPEV